MNQCVVEIEKNDMNYRVNHKKTGTDCDGMNRTVFETDY